MGRNWEVKRAERRDSSLGKKQGVKYKFMRMKGDKNGGKHDR